jgi:hypothetical protein
MDLNAILEEEKKLRKPGPKPLRKTRQLSELLMPLVPKAIKALSNALKDPDKDVSAAKEVLDRVYGKAPQAVDLKASGEIIISVNVSQKGLINGPANKLEHGTLAETATSLSISGE